MSEWGGRAVEFLQVGQIFVKHLVLGVQTTWPLFSCASVTLCGAAQTTGRSTGQEGLSRKRKFNLGKKKTQCRVLTE